MTYFMIHPMGKMNTYPSQPPSKWPQLYTGIAMS